MPDSTDTKPGESKQPLWQALGLAWELGYVIAVPLVVLALGGRLLDRLWGTSPWLLLVGVLLSIAVSTWLVYRKATAVLTAEAKVANPSHPSGNRTEAGATHDKTGV